jgi:glycine/D-amino acid oxidase-like deaminating enzyme
VPINNPYPTYETRCGWNALLPARTIRVGVELDSAYDVVIIGAGYTGIATAWRLAELDPGASILLLEAGEIGEGASGRNSGFLLTVPFFTTHAGHGGTADTATTQIRIYKAGLTWLKSIVDSAAIKCDWDDVGKYHAAATEAGTATIKSLATHYRECGVECAEIEAADFARRIGSSYYKYALHTQNNVYVQPAALVRGLADALPANVTVAERTPALSLSGNGPFFVMLPRKQVQTKKVVIANNGFAQNLGFFKSRLFNLYTYAGLTPELDGIQLAAHGADRDWGVTPAARAGTTLRKSIGNRFLVRSLHTYEREGSMTTVATQLEDCYRRRYPTLRSHKFEYIWSGAVGLSRNAASCFGRVAKDLYASVGCNGAGIIKGTAYGRLLAEQIMAYESQDLRDVQSMNSPSWIPPEPFRRWGVSMTIRRMVRQAGIER